VILIDAPYFCCAVVLDRGRVTRAAPIVGYMHGWSAQHVLKYCRSRGWQATVR
jgi:hypothetical protein